MVKSISQLLGLFPAIFSGLSVILTLPSAFASEPSCKLLIESVRKFEFKDPRKEGHTFLGEGEFGKVELKKSLDGHYYVVKTYKGDTIKPSSQMNSDFRALKHLARYSQRLTFSVPQVEKFEVRSLKMTYHPGRTVADLWLDRNLNYELKTQIQIRYEKLVTELVDLLEDQEFDIDENRRGDLTRISASNDSFAAGAIDFIIKPDNVIVDPETLNLTLIDPY